MSSSSSESEDDLPAISLGPGRGEQINKKTESHFNIDLQGLCVIFKISEIMHNYFALIFQGLGPRETEDTTSQQ